MGSSKTTLKKTIFIFIVVILSVPIVQQISGFAYVVPLKGAIKKVEKPNFSFKSWFDGDYQTHAEEYINSSFGFRTPFVKLHNQLDYWLFGKINAKSVLIGKEGYLFEIEYIKEYLGENFLGKEAINKKVATLKSVSDSLSVRGIDLVVILAAGKASYYPEYFPDELQLKEKTISNYDYFSSTIDSAGIHNIDFNSWFVDIKDTVQYPLFTKGGIHWSKYSEYLVLDSLIRYIEDLRGIQLPHFKVVDMDVSILPQYRDNDIGDGMNLIFPHSSLWMAYPELIIEQNKDDVTINAMVVADSYYWELYNEGLSKDIFNFGQFWYYNVDVYSEKPGWYKKPVEELDIKHEVEKNDIVFILQTEASLYRLGFGFIEKQYEIYSKKENNTK